MLIAFKLIQKPRVRRWCARCGEPIEGETVRCYGAAELGDKPYAIYVHRGCFKVTVQQAG